MSQIAHCRENGVGVLWARSRAGKRRKTKNTRVGSIDFGEMEERLRCNGVEVADGHGVWGPLVAPDIFRQEFSLAY